MNNQQAQRSRSHHVLTTSTIESSAMSDKSSSLTHHVLPEQHKSDVYWLELCLRIYFLWCTACVAAINTIFLVNIYVDFMLQWEEIHSSVLDWIPFSIDSLSFVYLFFQLLELNYHFMCWCSYHYVFDEITLSQIANELKKVNRFDRDKVSLAQIIANVIGSTSLRSSVLEAPLTTMLLHKITYILPQFKKWYPNISAATFLRFVALLIASFVGVLNTVIMHEDINDATFLYAFSKISLWLGLMLFILYIISIITGLSTQMKHKYNRQSFTLNLCQSASDYHKWRPYEVILGAFGLFIVLSMFFNGYSFYFVLLTFIIYTISYLIWKYKSAKHSFFLLFESVPTAFAIKKVSSKICCSCIGFGVIFLPLILSFIASSSKSIHNNLQSIKDNTHLYPICASNYGGLTISDLSYLSALSYHGTTKESIIAGLNVYFEESTLILDEDGSVYNEDEDENSLIYIAAQLDKEPIFYHVKDTASNSHYIVIRGSASMKDFIQDMQLFSEIGVIQVVSHIFPLLYIWPTQMILELISFCSVVEGYWLSPGHDMHYFKDLETYLNKIVSDGIVADQNVYIIGHSLGGGVAQIVGARYYEHHNCNAHEHEFEANQAIKDSLEPFEVHSIGFNSPGTFYSSGKFGFKPISLDYTSTSVLADRDMVGAIDNHGGVMQTVDCQEKTWIRCHSALHTFCKLYYGCYYHDHHHVKDTSHKELFVHCLCSANGISEKECQKEFGDYMPIVHQSLDGELSWIH